MSQFRQPPRPMAPKPGAITKALPYVLVARASIDIIDKVIKIVLNDGSHRQHRISDHEIDHYHSGGELHLYDANGNHCFTLRK